MPSESVAFMLCRRVAAFERTLYLCDQVLEVGADEYAIQDHNIASVAPSAMARTAKAARNRGLIVVMAHLHPMCESHVEFSQADHLGNARSFRFFHQRAPAPEHLALVWNETIDECKGLVIAADGSSVELDSVVVVDEVAWREFVRQDDSASPGQYARQALLLGEAGQRRMHRIRLVVVGAGGTGSLVSMAAVHHGVEDLWVVDDDVVEGSNLPRVVGATPLDVEANTPKVVIAVRYAQAHSPGARIEGRRLNVEDPELLRTLASADVIAVGTDNTTSRAFLNQLSHQYLVPLLDLGVEFVVDADSKAVVNEIGRVNLMRPGTPCLLCTGHINARRLAAESIPKDERQREGSYLRGMDDPQPSMLAFNMEVAGRAMQVLVGYITGFLGMSLAEFEQRTFLKRRGGSLSRAIAKVGNHDCIICGGAGVVGVGDETKMFIGKRAA